MSSNGQEIDWSNGPIGEDGQASSVVMIPYDEESALGSVVSGLQQKTEPEPDKQTPDPLPDEESGGQEGGGVIKRVNEYHSSLGPVALETIGLHGPELSKTIEKRQKELYRNTFPRLVKRFVLKCEHCGTEYDDEVEECTTDGCDSTEFRPPSQSQKNEAEEFFDEVNKEGQSLRQLYRYCEGDHSRLATGLHVVKKKYKVASKSLNVLGEEVLQEGQLVDEQVMELVRGDSKRIKPVVDENGRIGGHWYTCPIHREEGLDREDGSCSVCGCNLREVHYAEVERGSKPEKFYFKDEVVSWSFFNTRLNGLDGLSPIVHLWLEQAILQWMDLYAAGFFDSDNKTYPGKMLIVHTTNRDAFEKTLDEAKADKEESPYAQGIIYNEYGVESNSAPEAQVVDLMSDEILGQSEKLKKDYKNNIRTRYGISDVFDSELEDAGGLNNEGLQLEVTDRDIASAQQDMMEGPLRELMNILGYSDWEIKFLPPEREDEEMSVKDKAQTIRILKQANADFDITEDGEIEIIGAGGELPDTESNRRQEVEEGNSKPNEDEVSEGLKALEDGFKHIAWSDDSAIQTKASEPFFHDEQDVPEFVLSSLDEAFQSGALSPTYDEIPRSRVEAVHEFFRDKLSQPQGWSITSLVNDFSSRFDVGSGYAKTVIVDQVTSLFNKAREIGYEKAKDIGILGDETGNFHWVGPDDDSTTDCCNYIKDQTEDGVTLEELKEILQRARRKFFPDAPDREWIPHWGCRHTFVEAR